MAGFISSSSPWHTLGHGEGDSPFIDSVASALSDLTLCGALIWYSGPYASAGRAPGPCPLCTYLPAHSWPGGGAGGCGPISSPNMPLGQGPTANLGIGWRG